MLLSRSLSFMFKTHEHSGDCLSPVELCQQRHSRKQSQRDISLVIIADDSRPQTRLPQVHLREGYSAIYNPCMQSLVSPYQGY